MGSSPNFDWTELAGPRGSDGGAELWREKRRGIKLSDDRHCGIVRHSSIAASAGGMITTRETIKSSCRFTVATKKLNSFWEYRTRIGRRLKPNHPFRHLIDQEGLVIPQFRQSGVAPKNKNAGFDASAMHTIPVCDREPLNKARHRPFQPIQGRGRQFRDLPNSSYPTENQVLPLRRCRIVRHRWESTTSKYYTQTI